LTAVLSPQDARNKSGDNEKRRRLVLHFFLLYHSSAYDRVDAISPRPWGEDFRRRPKFFLAACHQSSLWNQGIPQKTGRPQKTFTAIVSENEIPAEDEIKRSRQRISGEVMGREVHQEPGFFGKRPEVSAGAEKALTD
jgi:hypothetical protein